MEPGFRKFLTRPLALFDSVAQTVQNARPKSEAEAGRFRIPHRMPVLPPDHLEIQGFMPGVREITQDGTARSGMIRGIDWRYQRCY